MTRSNLDREHLLELRNIALEGDATGIAILSITADGYAVEDVNAAFERITGHAADDLVGQTLDRLVGPRTSPEAAASIRQALSRGETFAGTLVAYCADGTPVWLDIAVAPGDREDGRLRRAVLTARDATELRRAQSALVLNRELGECVRNSSTPADTPHEVARLMAPDFADRCVIHILADDGTLDLAAVAPTPEKPPPDPQPDMSRTGIGLVAQSSIPLLHQPSDPNNPNLSEQMERILGTPVYAVVTVPIASDANNTFGTISLATTDDTRQFTPEDVQIAEDVGARLGHYFDMYRARESLSSALSSRESFLAQAGHELRTPVVSIRGYAQLLLRDIRRQSLSPHRLESGLKTIEASAARLSLLTEDLFTVYHRGSATVPLTLTTVQLGAYLREFFTSAESHLLHGHTLELTGIGEDAWVNIDLIRFSQVLYNLLNNAERFSPASSPIRISTSRQASGIAISIADAGQGLLSGEDVAIFDPFHTSRHRPDDVPAGLGISLYISRQIVERHNGRIWAESDGLDKGTTFKVLLPEVSPPRS